MERYKVKLNSIEKIEDLLQEIYDQACRQINEVQNEMNRLANSTNLGSDEVTMDEKAKYAKAMHDFMGDKLKAISAKFEVAKFMGELVKKSGDVAAVVNDKNFAKRSSLNFEDIRSQLSGDDDSITYDIK